MSGNFRNYSVSQCASLLDEVKPNWYTLVNLSQLDMHNGYKCILGQVFNDEAEANSHAYTNGYEYGWKLLGFCTEYPSTVPLVFVFSDEKNEWAREINVRKNKVTAPKFKSAAEIANWLDANKPEWYKKFEKMNPFTSIFGSFNDGMEALYGHEEQRRSVYENDVWFDNMLKLEELADIRKTADVANEGRNYGTYLFNDVPTTMNWLDEKVPGWFKRVDLKSNFTILNNWTNVIAQIFQEEFDADKTTNLSDAYVYGLGKLGLSTGKHYAAWSNKNYISTWQHGILKRIAEEIVTKNAYGEYVGNDVQTAAMILDIVKPGWANWVRFDELPSGYTSATNGVLHQIFSCHSGRNSGYQNGEDYALRALKVSGRAFYWINLDEWLKEINDRRETPIVPKPKPREVKTKLDGKSVALTINPDGSITGKL